MKQVILVIMAMMVVFSVQAAEYSMQMDIKNINLSTALSDDWTLDKYYNDNADIYQGTYLRANQTDGRAYLWKNISPPSNTTAITIDYDAAIQYSYWGQNTGVYLVMSDGTQFRFGSGMNNCCDNKNLHQFYIDKNTTRLSHIIGDLHYGVYHFTIIFSEEEISAQAKNASREIIYNETVSAPGLHPAEVSQLKYWVYTTTDNNSWMKNLSYAFVHHEKIAN